MIKDLFQCGQHGKMTGDARRQQMKARFEEHAKDMPAEKLAEIRANVAQTEAKVDAKLTEITADGTVTKEEADALRDVRRQLVRNREDFTVGPEDMPVFGTVASRFNDDGVTALYQCVRDLLAVHGLPRPAGGG